MAGLEGHESSHANTSSKKPPRARVCKVAGKLDGGGGDEPIQRPCNRRVFNNGKEQISATASAQVAKVIHRNKCRMDLKCVRNKT
jgi:hypothetical protein